MSNYIKHSIQIVMRAGAWRRAGQGKLNQWHQNGREIKLEVWCDEKDNLQAIYFVGWPPQPVDLYVVRTLIAAAGLSLVDKPIHIVDVPLALLEDPMLNSKLSARYSIQPFAGSYLLYAPFIP